MQDYNYVVRVVSHERLQEALTQAGAAGYALKFCFPEYSSLMGQRYTCIFERPVLAGAIALTNEMAVA